MSLLAFWGLLTLLYPKRKAKKTGISTKKRSAYAMYGTQASMPFSDIRHLRVTQLNTTIAQEVMGDPVKAEAATQEHIKNIQTNTNDVIDKQAGQISRHVADNECHRLTVEQRAYPYYLVAEDRHGREILVATATSSVDSLLLVAAALRQANPSIAGYIQVRAYADTDEECLPATQWYQQPPASRVLENTWIGAFLAFTTSWLWVNHPPILFTEVLTGWESLFSLVPYVILAPLWLALLLPSHEGPVLVRRPVDQEELSDGEMVNRKLKPQEAFFIGGMSAVSLVSFLGLRMTDFQLPVMIQLLLGGIVLALIMATSITMRWGRRLMTSIKSGSGVFFRTAFKQSAGGTLFLITALGAATLVLLMGLLGILSDTLMQVSPGGRGGKTAIPIYFDLAVTGILLMGMRVGIVAMFERQLAMFVSSAVIVSFMYIALYGIAFSGMSHLPAEATIFFLAYNVVAVRWLFVR
jgi:hypothetical protein